MIKLINTKETHWTGELLILFGQWLIEREEYGHGLLCIHGPIWGYKIGQQLELNWGDVYFDDEFGSGEFLEFRLAGKDKTKRAIGPLALHYIEMVAEKMGINDLSDNDKVYVNSKTGKPLSTSTLNRELQRFENLFLEDMEKRIGHKLKLKQLKSNSFQIAWALKMLERYRYSKKCLISISKFMGHRTLKDTIELLGVEPIDEIVYDFTGGFYSNDTYENVLDEKGALTKYIEQAIVNRYERFIRSIE